MSDELPEQPKTLQDISDDWKHRDDKPAGSRGKRAKSKSTKAPESEAKAKEDAPPE